MESDNPFIQRIHAEDEALENHEEITGEDSARYLLRGQTMKFSSPEAFKFIYFPVEFIAFSMEGDKVNSLLLYLAETEETYDILVTAFGVPDLSLEVDGEVEYKDADSEDQKYTSHTWIEGKYRMTFSIVPLKNQEDERVLKSQIYIVQ